MKTIVKKYGGATLSDLERIKAVALSLQDSWNRGEKLVVVVSAMGQTTNELISLAHQISPRPKKRELDMLLSTGERISMSLLSIALNDLHCPAISFTGSQAGIITDEAHLNAFITDVKPHRVWESLGRNEIVIIAGFQGVSPKTKEVTTLGRGGSDTTAVALAAALGADHCEILKDVSGVYSADPKICPSARALHELTYEQMLELTFWGAKVLHYRSVELALRRRVPIYIGPAHSYENGTWIKERIATMFETVRILSINSHSDVVKVFIPEENLSEGLARFQKMLAEKEIPLPQLLASENNASEKGYCLFLAGPTEIIEALRRELAEKQLEPLRFASVTVTCSGASTPEIATLVAQKLKGATIVPLRIWMSAMSCTVLLERLFREEAIQQLHQLIEPS